MACSRSWSLVCRNLKYSLCLHASHKCQRLSNSLALVNALQAFKFIKDREVLFHSGITNKKKRGAIKLIVVFHEHPI